MATLVAWLHLAAAAVWVGSQVFVGLVAVPALRSLPDPSARAAALAALTRRYGVLGWVSLAVLAATGLHRLATALPDPALLFAGGYGGALLAKLVLGAGIVVLTAAHTWVLGPRLLAALRAGSRAPRLARASLALSLANLGLGLAVLWTVAGLRAGG